MHRAPRPWISQSLHPFASRLLRRHSHHRSSHRHHSHQPTCPRQGGRGPHASPSFPRNDLTRTHSHPPILIDQLHITRYNQIRKVPVVLLVGERVGRYYRKLPDTIGLLEAYQTAASPVWALTAAICRPH